MKYLHVLALAFFVVALGFYIASSTMSSLVLSGIGVCIEAVAWVTALSGKTLVRAPKISPQHHVSPKPSARGDSA